jgi:hypothetical protein
MNSSSHFILYESQTSSPPALRGEEFGGRKRVLFLVEGEGGPGVLARSGDANRAATGATSGVRSSMSQRFGGSSRAQWLLGLKF